jgi:hypothetical protein
MIARISKILLTMREMTSDNVFDLSGAAIDANSAQVLARSHDGPTAIANKQAALSE